MSSGSMSHMSTPAPLGPATGAENVAAVEQAVLHEAI